MIRLVSFLFSDSTGKIRLFYYYVSSSYYLLTLLARI